MLSSVATSENISCLVCFDPDSAQVVIRETLDCGVYLSRVNTLQGNEGGQEEMAAAQKGR